MNIFVPPNRINLSSPRKGWKSNRDVAFIYVLGCILYTPNLHSFNTGLPYVIHSMVLLFLCATLKKRSIYAKDFSVISLVFILLIFSLLSLCRQFYLEGVIVSSDFSFLAKVTILGISLVLASLVRRVNNDINKYTLIFMYGMLFILFLQYLHPSFQTIYNNSNLLVQRRIASIGITHYEACTVSMVLSAAYLSSRLRINKKLTIFEGLSLIFIPMILSISSMSKAAIIVSALWSIIVLFYLNRRILALKVLCLIASIIFFAFHQQILVLFYGLSDLSNYTTTNNLSIITRFEDFSNFLEVFWEKNILLIGVGPNRSSYFYYFEIGLIANLVNIGGVGVIFYYSLLYFLSMKLFGSEHRKLALLFFAILFFGDCIVNFTDGVKSLAVLGFLAMLKYDNKSLGYIYNCK